MAKRKATRRLARGVARCRECGADTIKRETIVKGGATTVVLRCAVCDAVLPERRREQE